MLAALRPKREAPPMLDRLAAEVSEAEADLAHLRDEYGRYALEALEDADPSAEQRRKAARQALTDAERRLWDAQAAREAARTRDQRETAAEVARERKKAWREVANLAKERDAAARLMDKAIREFADAYETLAEASEKMWDACPRLGQDNRHVHPSGWGRTEGQVRQFLRHTAPGAWWACEIHPVIIPATVAKFVADANNQLLTLSKIDR